MKRKKGINIPMIVVDIIFFIIGTIIIIIAGIIAIS